MRFKINRKELLDTIKSYSGILKGKRIQPVLHCVRIEVCTYATVSVTDLETFVKRSLDVKKVVDNDKKAFCAYAKDLINILSSISSVDVEITIFNDFIQIEGDGAKVTLQTISADEFPQFPGDKESEKYSVEIDRHLLMDSTSQIGASASYYDSNNILSCVNFRFNDATETKKISNTLEFAATDGNRLAYKKQSLKVTL